MLENEKLEWLGRQIRILKAKPGEEGRKECEANAKQMAPAFITPDEQEVLKFFIHEGGGGGDGKGDGPSDPSQSTAPGESAQGDASKDAKPVEKSRSGGDDKSGKALPDGTYFIVKGAVSESNLAYVPADSPHRLKRGVALTDDKEFANYLFSAYGPTFNLNKYGDVFSITH